MATHDMTPAQFIAKWKPVDLSERAACQEHFIDLCRLLGQPTPAEHDATGAEYTFEKGVAVTGGASKRRQGRPRLRRRLVARQVRLGVQAQGQVQGPRRGLPPALPVPRGPGQPAAAGRLRHRPHRDPHQLHRHGQGRSTSSRLDDLDQPDSLDLLRRVFTDPRLLPPDHDRRARHRGGRRADRPARPVASTAAGTTRTPPPTSS